MKTFFLLIVFLTTSTLSNSQSTPVASNKKADWDKRFTGLYGKYFGLKLPEFQAKKLDSSPFSSQDFKNKVVFVNFWFAGCPPCIEELGDLNKLYSLLKDNPDFLFVSFTFDPDNLIKSSIKKYNIQYEVIHLDKPVCDRLKFGQPYPTSIILDCDGIIRYFTVGGADSESQEEIILNIFYSKITGLLKDH